MTTEPVDPWIWTLNLILASMIVTLPAGMLGYAIWKGSHRHREWRRLADAWGWHFIGRGNKSFELALDGLAVCPVGSRRLLQHVMTSPDAGPQVCLFDLFASAGPPRPGVGFHSQTVLWLEDPKGPKSRSAQRTKSSLSGLPPDHVAWVERRSGLAIYYIEDQLIRPSQLARFLAEGKRMIADNEATDRAITLQSVDDE
ncbi:hypothetical protein K2X85_04980 [bacterium]|jgi:hypothetical protein|nr:hypothetical protein [bacterium]